MDHPSPRTSQGARYGLQPRAGFPGPTTLHPGTLERLRALYAEYRRREVSGLLALVPREAIRTLYRAAREWGAAYGHEAGSDPMALLLRYVEGELLPLPPFPVWLADFQAHRREHVSALELGPTPPSPGDAVTVEVRRFLHGSDEWYASLTLFQRAEGWRGYLSFASGAGEVAGRTGDVFREADAASIRERFLGLDPVALQSFLRSVLP